MQNQHQSEQYTFKDLLNMELRWNSDVENVATAHSSEFFCESRSAGDFKTTLFPFDILASLNSREPSPCTMSSSRKNNIQRWKLDWEIHSSKHFSKPTTTSLSTAFFFCKSNSVEDVSGLECGIWRFFCTFQFSFDCTKSKYAFFFYFQVLKGLIFCKYPHLD